MAQQGPPQPRPTRRPAGRPRGAWPVDEDTGTDGYPPWAGPGIAPHWADGDRRERGRRGEREESDRDAAVTPPPAPRGPRSRAARARARRGRRARVIWGGAVAVILAIAATVSVLLVAGHRAAPAASSGNLVTTYLPGEMRTVPNVCSAVTPATLAQYLPGTRRTIAPHSLFGSAESMCDWSIDAPPRYRLLDVTARAYAPSGLATGDGSATFAAIDAYQQALGQKTAPPAKSHLPKAAVTRLSGLGNAAFAALQVPSAGGDTTDLVTLVVRDRNVLITVVFDGLAHSSNGRYGPVSAARLQAGAVAVARDVLSRLP